MAKFDLDGASVLIAGATGGLGSRIAREMADRGARLTLVSRSQDKLDALDVAGLRHAADLRLPGAAAGAVQAAVDANGGIDAVVNAAGVVAFGPLTELDTDTLEEVFLTNTFLPVMLMKAALDHFGDAGLIVNISAIVAERPMPKMAAYSASKAALTAFDTAVAREVRRAGVTVLDVRPPHTETGLADRPVAGEAPKLPEGADPDKVAARIVEAIEAGDSELAADDF